MQIGLILTAVAVIAMVLLGFRIRHESRIAMDETASDAARYLEILGLSSTH